MAGDPRSVGTFTQVVCTNTLHFVSESSATACPLPTFPNGLPRRQFTIAHHRTTIQRPPRLRLLRRVRGGQLAIGDSSASNARDVIGDFQFTVTTGTTTRTINTVHRTLGQMEEAAGQAQHAQNVALWVLGKVAEALFESTINAMLQE
eukprot:COSAG02_NODE_5550_length_4236_cov_4.498671_2_plen_148_part_00